ncbi:MAG: hypothetical protein R3F11_26190 [Verrucomicrobiales bacterium]
MGARRLDFGKTDPIPAYSRRHAPPIPRDHACHRPDRGGGRARQDPAAWTEKDTALANHYLAALQASPEYGNVLDLLWNLYDAKGQSAFLIDHFRAMAAADGALREASTIQGTAAQGGRPGRRGGGV